MDENSIMRLMAVSLVVLAVLFIYALIELTDRKFEEPYDLDKEIEDNRRDMEIRTLTATLELTQSNVDMLIARVNDLKTRMDKHSGL